LLINRLQYRVAWRAPAHRSEGDRFSGDEVVRVMPLENISYEQRRA
jgi:hypothetical protein